MRSILASSFKVLFVLWLISMLFLSAWFSTENIERISPVLLGWKLRTASSGIYLLATLTVGVGFGFLLSFLTTRLSLTRARRAVKRKEKEIKQLQQQLQPSAKRSVITLGADV
ncbi:MAG: uncharacterized membrane protein YciS (DUF1049 family) [Flavobacteriales bacterium]|jgi:uncharacterized membrane protein YciS (DUF1049 family)